MKLTKPIPILLICFAIHMGFAQFQPAEIVFNSGEKKMVIGKIKGSTFKYKLFRKGKSKIVRFEDLDYVRIQYNKGASLVTYRLIKIKDSPKPIVLKHVKTGQVNLYVNTVSGSVPNMGGFGFGGMGGAAMGTTQFSISNYYLKRQNETEATHVGSTQLFSKNFREAASQYFSDCSVLVSKIQDKTFKKKDLVEIVDFYNTKCQE